MKRILLILLVGVLAASCGASKKTASDIVKEKAHALSDLQGATVESVVDADGAAALKVTFDSGILFAFNKSVLSDESKQLLDRLVDGIADMPDSRIRVYGHTDIVGSAEVNQAVSTQRANEVAKYLQEKGIAPERIHAAGMSFTQPIADNSTDEGRAKNRRVEIFVIPAQ